VFLLLLKILIPSHQVLSVDYFDGRNITVRVTCLYTYRVHEGANWVFDNRRQFYYHTQGGSTTPAYRPSPLQQSCKLQVCCRTWMYTTLPRHMLYRPCRPYNASPL